MDISVSNADELDKRIRYFIELPSANDVSFQRLALELFAHQYACNPGYRLYCDRFGQTPESVHGWLNVPAIPTSAFGLTRLACFPAEHTQVTFLSSGTTGAQGARSRHELTSTALYDASLLAHFRPCVMPDKTSIQMLFLAPSFAQAPQSSLSYMLSKLSQTLGTKRDAFLIRDDKLDFESAAGMLRTVAEPVAVIGTAFAFVHFFERCEKEGLRVKLPRGSRVVETGGFKGRSREVSGERLYRWFSDILGIPRVFCVSEYGMCELGSQWYDANLADYFAEREARVGIKIGPHWTRIAVVDPVTGKPVREGRQGLLQVFDLSNRGSVAAVLTADVARIVSGGFELIGRFAGAPPKGCSIAIDALLEHGAR